MLRMESNLLNREILRHLKALIYDERILSRWSHGTVFPIIRFLLNSHVSSETGMEPFRLRFGDRDKIFMQLPATDSLPDSLCEFVRRLNENLSTLTGNVAKVSEGGIGREAQA